MFAGTSVIPGRESIGWPRSPSAFSLMLFRGMAVSNTCLPTVVSRAVPVFLVVARNAQQKMVLVEIGAFGM